jgi:hypothetical protein
MESSNRLMSSNSLRMFSRVVSCLDKSARIAVRWSWMNCFKGADPMLPVKWLRLACDSSVLICAVNVCWRLMSLACCLTNSDLANRISSSLVDIALERVVWIAKGSVGLTKRVLGLRKECLGVLRMILARDFLFEVCNARRISVLSLSWFSLVVFWLFLV